MKKIYEKPMVELTQFDVEDIILASGGGGTTMDLSKADALDETATKAIKANVGGADAVGVYNW